MKHNAMIRTWRTMAVVLEAVLAMLVLTWKAGADDLVIKSFDSTGQLVFNELTTGISYRVEWAPSPSGPWQSFTTAGSVLDDIMATGSGSVTCSVPMCYRVTAMVHGGGMVLIPAGTNTCTNSLDVSGTYSLTNTQAFCMDMYEVTKARWDEVRTWSLTNGYSYQNAGSGKATNHPVHSINWADTLKWCNARSEQEGRTPVYYTNAAYTVVYKTGTITKPYIRESVNGYRLPTDTKWQYAARGGAVGHRYAWSDTDDIMWARANYQSMNPGAMMRPEYDKSPGGYHPAYTNGTQPYTSPVGSFAPNGYGLFDMTGNISEWTEDLGNVAHNHSIKGGSWATSPEICQIANGNILTVGTTTNHFYGFRTIRSP